MATSSLAILLIAVATAQALAYPQKIKCSNLDVPQYGRVRVSGYSPSSVAYYSCNYGYDLYGLRSRRCQADGSWYGEAPTCRPVKKNCPKPIAPRYGKVSVNGNSYSSRAYYTCDYGYELQGSYSRKCQHDGTWYGDAPVCREAKKNNCPNLNDIRYGKVWVSRNSYSSIAYYTCNYGYELRGSYSRKCQHDGTWYGKAPACIKAKITYCPKLTTPKYGQVWVTGNTYSSTAYYRCNYGYELHGSYSRKCLHDGTWYGAAPVCREAKRNNCPKLNVPQYGKVWVASNSYSSIAYYSCDYGYELQGSYSRKCQYDGTWYGKAPACVKAKTNNCPKPDSPQYGKVSVTGHSYSSTAYYTCNYGYELQGSYSRKCQHDGTWYGKAPSCIKAKTIYCPKLVAPQYGKVWENGNTYSSIAYYSCNYGYELRGAYSRKCQHDGTWYGDVPVCVKAKTIYCPKLALPKYGQVWVTGNTYSSTAYYRCNYGYELHGSHSRKCLHDGTWYGDAPVCREAKKNNCPQTYDPKYGKVWVSRNSYSSIAYYSCNYGYELRGSYSRKCQHDGTWYGKAPACVKAKNNNCNNLDAPQYGKVWVSGNSYSSTAYYRCDYGYELQGAYSRKCQHDGTWYGKAPICRPVKKVNCPTLYNPQYGKVSMNGNSYLSTAYYSCNYGYELQGSHSRKCQHDGTWYGDVPTCRPIKKNCPKLDHPSYGKVIVRGYTPESVAYYSCQQGYKLHGPASRKCQHNGSWYGSVPTCRRIKY